MQGRLPSESKHKECEYYDADFGCFKSKHAFGSELYSFHHKLNQVKDATTYVDFSVTSRMEAWAVPQKQRQLERWRSQSQRTKSNQLTIISDILHNTFAAYNDRVMEEGAAETVLDQEIRPVFVHLNQLRTSASRETVHQLWQCRALICDIAWMGYFMNTFSMLSDFTASKSKFIDSEKYGKNISNFITKCTKLI